MIKKKSLATVELLSIIAIIMLLGIVMYILATKVFNVFPK